MSMAKRSILLFQNYKLLCSTLSFVLLLISSKQIQTAHSFLVPTASYYCYRNFLPKYRSTTRIQASTEATGTDEAASSSDGIRLFLDIVITGEPVGRLVFQIPDPMILPLHIENIMKLCTQERVSIDPRCKYIGCEFQHSPQFVEGLPQYRWGHVLKGRGRNAVGRGEDRISDPINMSKCTNNIYGGQYYGLDYDEDVPIFGEKDTRVVLTVPLVGPGRGSTDLSIVRVGESPPEWKQRLLLNCAVLGWLEPSSMETLHAMARQTRGPPKVIDSGVL